VSNVEPEQPGVIDAALLARLVPVWSVVSPDVMAGATGEGTTPISRDDAVDRIRATLAEMFPVPEPGLLQQLGNLAQSGSFAGGATRRTDRPRKALEAAAELIVDSVPEEARTERMLAQLNVLPYMQQLVENEQAVFRTSEGKTHRVSDISGPVQAGLLVAQERNVEAVASNEGLAPGVVRDPITGQLTFQSPTGPQVLADVAQDVRINERYGGIPFNGLPLQFDLTNVVQPVRAGRVPSPQFAGFAGDVVTGGQIPMSTPTQQMPAGVTGRSGQVNAKQALDFLYSLSAQEVEQLQDRMRAAGYFTQMGYDQDSGQQIMAEITYEPGYTDDPATSAAWQQVLVDAAGEGRAVDELLRNKSMDFERRRQNMVESTTQQRTQQFAGSLRNVREMADEFAIETLGRRLTVDEFVGVRDYVRKLQGERAGQIAGRELEPWMAEAPEMGFTERELGEQVVETLGQSELDRPGGSIWTRLQEKYGF
jgi:hypothetical protein